MMKDKFEEALIYFEPLRLSEFTDLTFKNDPFSLGNAVFTNLVNQPLTAKDKFEVVILFAGNTDIKQEEGTNNNQPLREEIYQLKRVSANLRIADPGNLKKGRNEEENLFILQEVCTLFLQMKINVLVIGGSQSNTISLFKSIKEFENDINLVNVDSRIDLKTEESTDQENWLNTIIEQDASHLYNITCLGYQSYFVDPKQINYLSEKYFEHYRLGKIRENLEEVEPIVRDADVVSFDMSSIKAADAPAVKKSSPNGFFSDEACSIARYAGLSDRVRAFGIFETAIKLDFNKQTSKLVAQMVWYYLEGFLNRKHEYPIKNFDDSIKYVVEIDEIEIPIVFYKSNKTKRWWIEINNLPEGSADRVSVVASCSENDYFKACNNEIPDKWWINFKKLR